MNTLLINYGVELLYNPEYTSKNTLTTIYRARKVLEGRNMYVLSSDNWMRENMYHAYECGAWYSSAFQRGETREWCLYFNKRGGSPGVKVGGRDQVGHVWSGLFFPGIFPAVPSRAGSLL